MKLLNIMPLRNPKRLYSGRDAEDSVRMLTCQSGHQEGEAIALFLKKCSAAIQE